MGREGGRAGEVKQRNEVKGGMGRAERKRERGVERKEREAEEGR